MGKDLSKAKMHEFDESVLECDEGEPISFRIITKNVKNLEKNVNYGIIPRGVLHDMLLFFDLNTYFNAILACKLFHVIGSTNVWWKDYYMNTFPDEFMYNLDSPKKKHPKKKTTNRKVNWKRQYYENYTSLSYVFLTRVKRNRYTLQQMNRDKTEIFHGSTLFVRYVSSLIESRAKKKKTEHYDGKSIQITICGDESSQKTETIIMFSTNKFPDEYVPTVFDSYDTDFTVNKISYPITLVDTAGQEDYDEIRMMSYENTDVVLICFDVESPESLYSVVEKYIPEVENHGIGSSSIVLCGLYKPKTRNNDLVIRKKYINRVIKARNIVFGGFARSNDFHAIQKIFNFCVYAYLFTKKL